jgi:tetratricopeptide (TPR) repeat protein
VGTTNVVCTADSSSCSFQVSVTGARSTVLDCLTNLLVLRAAATAPHDIRDLDDAIEHFAKALDPALWIDDLHLQRQDGDKFFQEGKKAIRELAKLLKNKKSAVPDDDLRAAIDCILGAAHLLAEVAVDEAEAAGGNPKKIEEDREEIAKGEEAAADGKFERAIDHYKDAWKHAVHLKVSPPHRLASGGTRLTFIGVENESYTIQASSDLIHWTTIATARAGADGEVTIDDPAANGEKARFYRILTE